MVGADVFVGLSNGGAINKDNVKSMAKNPIIFAMANPDPEILPVDAKEARSDVITATGRSDFANQVNNVLGFPFIFRGALDVRATKINDEMKVAAAYSLAALAKEPVPEKVAEAYGNEKFEFGPDYIVPKPFDPRVFGMGINRGCTSCDGNRRFQNQDRYRFLQAVLGKQDKRSSLRRETDVLRDYLNLSVAYLRHCEHQSSDLYLIH